MFCDTFHGTSETQISVCERSLLGGDGLEKQT